MGAPFEDEAGDRGRWYGKYRSFVRDVNDPEHRGRLRLEVPAVLGTGRAHWSGWALPCFPYGGNPDRGLYLLPEDGASVWAEFEGGDPQYPIWSGVWLAPGETPAEAGPHRKVLKSPSGHLLLFDDTPQGTRVLLRGIGTLIIDDGAGSSITLSGGNVTIQAAGVLSLNP